MGPMSERESERVYSGALRNLNTDDYFVADSQKKFKKGDIFKD